MLPRFAWFKDKLNMLNKANDHVSDLPVFLCHLINTTCSAPVAIFTFTSPAALAVLTDNVIIFITLNLFVIIIINIQLVMI